MCGCMCCKPDTADIEERESLIQQAVSKTRTHVNTGVLEMEIELLRSEIPGFKKQIEELKTQNQSLTTRLSQICSMKITDGNPTVVDLSDLNRADRLVEQFSELYDNQWTESFQMLRERLDLLEKNVIEVLLKIILKVYDICICEVKYQNKKLEEALSLFTGVKDMDQAYEPVIQESLHNLRSVRAKMYSLTTEDFATTIRDSLRSTINPEACSVCEDYIAECIKICWLMCIKFPPMYISAEAKEDFDHNIYKTYTESGKHTSYVVWPVLFQYETGPIIKRGIAQGSN